MVLFRIRTRLSFELEVGRVVYCIVLYIEPTYFNYMTYLVVGLDLGTDYFKFK